MDAGEGARHQSGVPVCSLAGSSRSEPDVPWHKPGYLPLAGSRSFVDADRSAETKTREEGTCKRKEKGRGRKSCRQTETRRGSTACRAGGAESDPGVYGKG